MVKSRKRNNNIGKHDTFFQMSRAGLFQEMLFEPGPGGFEGASSRSADKTLQEVGWGAERSLVWTKIPMWPRVESADG